MHDVGSYLEPLQAGMVLTIEPGIYLPDRGSLRSCRHRVDFSINPPQPLVHRGADLAVAHHLPPAFQVEIAMVGMDHGPLRVHLGMAPLALPGLDAPVDRDDPVGHVRPAAGPNRATVLQGPRPSPR